MTPVTPPTWTTGGNDPKTWSANRTSENTLLDYLGEDSENWVNKHTRINAIQQNVMGKMRDVLYAESLEPEEQPKKKAPASTKPTATPPAEGDTSTISEEIQRYVRYHEKMIGKPIDSADWNNMSKPIRTQLTALNWIIYQDGYPTLSNDAKQALE